MGEGWWLSCVAIVDIEGNIGRATILVDNMDIVITYWGPCVELTEGLGTNLPEAGVCISNR